ncbi:MAG: hypothetical protein AAF532_03150 [Planctomycetota bacterium]
MTITATRDGNQTWTASADIEPAKAAVGLSPDHAFSQLVMLLEVDFAFRQALRRTAVMPGRVVWQFNA